MIIFTLHATTTALRDMSTRAQQTVEHREIGRKPRARRDQYALHEQAIHAARLRDATAARSGWHSNGKPHGGGECSHAPRRKESSRPWPKEAAANGFARARPSAAAGLLRPMPKSELLRNLESKFTVLEWLAQLLGVVSIDLPAARSALAKI